MMDLTSESLYLLGAGGHGQAVWNLAQDSGYQPVAFIDHHLQVASVLELPVYSEDRWLQPQDALIISIGDNTIRARLSQQLQVQYPVLVHPRAVRARRVTIDAGTVVMPGAVLQVGVQIGRHTIINTRASIDHESRIGDYVHIAPGAVLSGDVVVENLAQVGIGAVIDRGLRIGVGAVVGAGAVVLEHVPDYAVVVGSPARVLRYAEERQEKGR